MYDLDAIEAINVDQLVTATDRVLFGNLKKHRLARGTTSLVVPAQLAVAATEERTIYVRDDHRSSYVVALGTAAAILWLAVGFVCLLA